jgi:hypothetical protein
MQHQGGNGAVNTAAHGHQYFSFPAHGRKDTYSHKIVFYLPAKTCKLPFQTILSTQLNFKL